MIHRLKGGVMALSISLIILVILGGCARPNPANTVNIAGSSSVQPLSEELANTFMKENSKISINVAGGVKRRD